MEESEGRAGQSFLLSTLFGWRFQRFHAISICHPSSDPIWQKSLKHIEISLKYKRCSHTELLRLHRWGIMSSGSLQEKGRQCLHSCWFSSATCSLDVQVHEMDRLEEVSRKRSKMCKRLILACIYLIERCCRAVLGKHDVEEDWRRLL